MRPVSATQQPFVFLKCARGQQGSERSDCSRLYLAEAANAPSEIVCVEGPWLAPIFAIPGLRMRYIRASRRMHVHIILQEETDPMIDAEPGYDRRQQPASI